MVKLELPALDVLPVNGARRPSFRRIPCCVMRYDDGMFPHLQCKRCSCATVISITGGLERLRVAPWSLLSQTFVVSLILSLCSVLFRSSYNLFKTA